MQGEELQQMNDLINRENLKFIDFLYQVQDSKYEQNTTSTGTTTIKQTLRNNIRAEGIEALMHDLKMIYGEDFEIVRTKEGIVFTVLTDDDEQFSWELKSTIKALDFDPFAAAEMFQEEQDAKQAKKDARRAEEEQKQIALEAKRQAKLLEIERKNQVYQEVKAKYCK